MGHEVDLLKGAAVYACDFRGEWSAFDGRIVRRQARFAKRVAKILAKRHSSKVVVVGHSMGGVVGLLAADATKTISAVVALAAPLAAHPFAFERHLAGIYPLPLETPLAKISGGPRDWQAPSWLVGGVGVEPARRGPYKQSGPPVRLLVQRTYHEGSTRRARAF